MKMAHAEIISGLIFIVVSAWFLFQAMQFPPPINPTDVGPGAFPIVIAVLISIFSIVVIVKGFLDGSKTGYISIKRWKSIVVSIGVIILYGFAISIIGLYLATALFFPVLLILASERNWKAIVGVTILYGVFAFGVFDTFLNVPLP